MINEALSFLAAELNTHLKQIFKWPEDAVVVSSVTDFNGHIPTQNQNKIVVTLINIKEETAIRNNPSYRIIDNSSVQINPALYVNLFILFSANFSSYNEGLKFISASIGYFQSNSVFTKDTFAKLNPAIDPLILELDSTSYQDWSYLWGMLGGKYLPSVIYKLRLLTIQESALVNKTPLISKVKIKVARTKASKTKIKKTNQPSK